MYYNDVSRLDTIFPWRILSYKRDIQRGTVSPEDASIVYFHGRPKPHQIANESWVRRHWV